MVEQPAVNRQAVGSSPTSSVHGDYCVKVNILDCDSRDEGSSPSNHPMNSDRQLSWKSRRVKPFVSVVRFHLGPYANSSIAQRIEYTTSNRAVVSSSLTATIVDFQLNRQSTRLITERSKVRSLQSPLRMYIIKINDKIYMNAAAQPSGLRQQVATLRSLVRLQLPSLTLTVKNKIKRF